MRSAYVTELRRSPLRWFLPLLLSMDLAVLFGRSRDWIGVWPQASAAVQLTCYFLGLGVAAGAAFCSGRRQRSGTSELFAATVRRPWQRESAALAATGTYGLAVLAVGGAAAAAASASEAGPGFLWPSYLLLGASLLLLATGLGHLAGKFSTSRYLPVVAAFFAIFLLSVFRVAGDHLYYVLSGPVQIKLSSAAVSTRLALSICVCAVAVLAEPSRARTAHDRLWNVPTTVATCILGTLVLVTLTGGPLTTQRRPPSQPRCSSAVARVCVWPEDEKYLPALSAQAARLAAAVTPVLALPQGPFMEAGLRTTENDNDFTTSLGLWGTATSLAGSVINSADSIRCSNVSPANSDAFYHDSFEILQWLVTRTYGEVQPEDVRGGPPGVDLPGIAALIREPAAAQQSWLQGEIGQLRRLCG